MRHALALFLLIAYGCAPAPDAPPPDDPRPAAPLGGDPRDAAPDPALPVFTGSTAPDAPDEAAWRDAALAEMRASRARVQRCVEARLRVTPGLTGRWTVHLVAQHDGHPRDVRVVGDTRDDPALEQCIAAVAATWRFPRSAVSRGIAMPYVIEAASRKVGP